MNIFIKKKKKKKKQTQTQTQTSNMGVSKVGKRESTVRFCVVPSRTVGTLDPGLGNWHDYRAVIKVENLSYS